MELRIGRRSALAAILTATVTGLAPIAFAAHADGTNNGKHLGNGKGTTTAPDPCLVLSGPASYYDTPPFNTTGAVTPFLTFRSDLGTYSGDFSNPEGPLCAGYTYAITATSQDGSPLGWLMSTSSPGTSITPANDPTSTTETFALTPSSPGQTLSVSGTTNGYTGATATACSDGTSLHVTVTVTSPDGTKTVFDHLGGYGDSNLCATISTSGGTSFYG